VAARWRRLSVGAKIMAVSLIVTVPLVVLVLIFQRRIVSGLTAGAVKG
jgi:trehalose/maltose transport system permease protein